MTGNNFMEWNLATMLTAINHYLDTVLLKEPGKAKAVAITYGQDGAFKIRLESTEKKV